jgi:hypothetical protein
MCPERRRLIDLHLQALRESGALMMAHAHVPEDQWDQLPKSGPLSEAVRHTRRALEEHCEQHGCFDMSVQKRPRGRQPKHAES